MMNRILLFCMTGWMLNLAPNLFAYPGSVPKQEHNSGVAEAVSIPTNTEIVLTLQGTISTRTAMAGDKFHGQVAVPVVVNDRVVIPVNSWVVGEVKSCQRAGRIRGRAELQLGFNSIILPSGETHSILARLRTADGYQSREIVNTEGAVKAESQKGKDAGTVARGAAAGSVIVGAASRSFKGAGIGGAGGAATGLGMVLLGRGDDVTLHRGSQLTMVLDQEVLLSRR